MGETKLKGIFDKATIALFFGVLWLPLIGSALKLGTSSSKTTLASERRLQAELPKFAWTQRYFERFPRKFEAYFDDRFGFRENLIYAHNYIKTEVLKASSSPSVVLGKENWLYIADEQRYNRSQPLTAAELENWKRLLECRQNWLKGQGIQYVFAIAPNKSTLYPEFLPDAANFVPPISRLDQLMGYLEKNSTVQILDLRKPLQQNKSTYRVYQKTDTHWNEVGAFIASREIINNVREKLPAVKQLPELKEVKIAENTQIGGDLAHMLKLQSIYPEQNLQVQLPQRKATYAGILKEGTASVQEELPLGMQGIAIAYEVKDPALPRAVFFGDSFGQLLLPFLPESFSRTVYLGGLTFNPQLVEKERPAIVLQEIAERHLEMSLTPAQIQSEWKDTNSATASCRAGM
jgi:hypothetical protein